MKKMFAILLALSLILTLAACGNDENDPTGSSVPSNAPDGSSVPSTAAIQEPSTDPTEDPAVIQQKQKDYDRALNILKRSQSSFGVGVDYNVKEAYDLLTALGDYQDAAAYLACIEIIPNVRLKSENYILNAFGEENLHCEMYYAYDREGKLLTAPGNLSMLTMKRYTYNEDGSIASVSECWDVNNTQSKCTYVYENGTLVRMETMTKDGGKFVEYIENGLIVREVGDGYEGTFTYDENGLKLTAKWMDTVLNTKMSSAEYEYELNTDGNVIRTVTHFKAGPEKFESVHEYTYENGLLVSEAFEDQGITWKIVYSYGDFYCYTPAE